MAYRFDYGDTNNNLLALMAAFSLAKRLKRVLLVPDVKNGKIFEALDEAALHELDGYVEWERRPYLSNHPELWPQGRKAVALEPRTKYHGFTKEHFGIFDKLYDSYKFTWPRTVQDWDALAARPEVLMYFDELLHVGIYFDFAWHSVVMPHMRPAKPHIDFARRFIRERMRGEPYVAVHVRTHEKFTPQLPSALDLAGQVAEALTAATARVRRRAARKGVEGSAQLRVGTVLVLADMVRKNVLSALVSELQHNAAKYGVTAVYTTSDVSAMGPPRPAVITDETLGAMAEHFIHNPDSTVSGMIRLYRVRLLGKSPGSATVMRKDGKPVKQVTELFLPVDCQRKSKPRPCMPFSIDPRTKQARRLLLRGPTAAGRRKLLATGSGAWQAAGAGEETGPPVTGAGAWDASGHGTHASQGSPGRADQPARRDRSKVRAAMLAAQPSPARTVMTLFFVLGAMYWLVRCTKAQPGRRAGAEP